MEDTGGEATFGPSYGGKELEGIFNLDSTFTLPRTITAAAFLAGEPLSPSKQWVLDTREKWRNTLDTSLLVSDQPAATPGVASVGDGSQQRTGSKGDCTFLEAQRSSKGRNKQPVSGTLLQSPSGQRFDKVFGNAAFDPAPVAVAPAARKNGFFDDSSNSPVQHLGAEDPAAMSSPCPSSDGPAAGVASLFRRITTRHSSSDDAAEEACSTPVQPFQATPVQPFRAAEVASLPRAQRSLRDTSLAAWEVELKQMLASRMQAEALSRAAPSQGMVRCYVKRVKTFFGTSCIFELHLQNCDTFLLAARRRKKSKVSCYILCQDQEDLARDSESCVAKLKANFVGTEYMLWGRSGDPSIKKGFASEELCVNFKTTAMLSTGSPHAMNAALPTPDARWRPSEPDGSDGLSTLLEAAKARSLAPAHERHLSLLCTLPPEFDEGLNAFALDFKGRVKDFSVKNFQLVTWDHNSGRKGAEPVLQFGKSGDDNFILDFAYPLSVTTAFAIALANVDTKICYMLG